MIGILQGAWITLISFLPLITLVVTVHELGHFLAAKWCGVAIDRFSLGFGRAIVSRVDRSGVEWRIGWIPIGGYVRFAGDENAASVPDHEDLEALRRDIVRREGAQALARYYHFKPVWQRAIIAAAGPAANFLLAVTIFTSLLLAFGQDTLPPRIEHVDAGTPAERAGFQPGDLVVGIQGKAVTNFEDLAQTVQLRVGLPTSFVVERAGARMTLTATPEMKLRADGLGHMRKQGTLGIRPVQDRAVVRHHTFGLFEALQAGVEKTGRIVSSTVYYLGRMITGQVPADQLSGPVGIAGLAHDVAHASSAGAPNIWVAMQVAAVNLVGLAGVISVSIGFLNLLPIPVLDGGHLLFYAYEALARRPLAAKVQAAGYRLGLALVLGLLLFGTWNDLQQLSVLKILGGS